MLNIAKDDGVVLKYLWRDEYENMSLNIWYDITRGDGYCIDIGAHTGIYSIIGNLNKEVLNFLVKASIPNIESTSIKEAKARKKEKFNTSKDQVLNSEELASRRREISGNSNKKTETVTDTIVREVPKIGRNEKVQIKNISTGENKTLKFKQAKPLIDSGEWIMVLAK